MKPPSMEAQYIWCNAVPNGNRSLLSDLDSAATVERMIKGPLEGCGGSAGTTGGGALTEDW